MDLLEEVIYSRQNNVCASFKVIRLINETILQDLSDFMHEPVSNLSKFENGTIRNNDYIKHEYHKFFNIAVAKDSSIEKEVGYFNHAFEKFHFYDLELSRYYFNKIDTCILFYDNTYILPYYFLSMLVNSNDKDYISKITSILKKCANLLSDKQNIFVQYITTLQFYQSNDFKKLEENISLLGDLRHNFYLLEELIILNDINNGRYIKAYKSSLNLLDIHTKTSNMRRMIIAKSINNIVLYLSGEEHSALEQIDMCLKLSVEFKFDTAFNAVLNNYLFILTISNNFEKVIQLANNTNIIGKCDFYLKEFYIVFASYMLKIDCHNLNLKLKCEQQMHCELYNILSKIISNKSYKRLVTNYKSKLCTKENNIYLMILEHLLSSVNDSVHNY